MRGDIKAQVIEAGGSNRCLLDFPTRVVARLSGHPIQDRNELEKRLQEIQLLASHLNRQSSGGEAGSATPNIEYYRRLNLIAEIEAKQVNGYLWGPGSKSGLEPA